MPAQDPADRVLTARIAAHQSWANTEDTSARTAPARTVFEERFTREAREMFGDLPPDELARRAEHLRKAYFYRLALKSAQARRRKRSGLTRVNPASTPDSGAA